ncbi:MAG: hypothetical protein WC626_13475 [Methanoregula sp.]
MDDDQINYIKHRLQRYEESILETEEHFSELKSFGNYRACAPYYEKFNIPHLIDALKSDGDICTIFWKEYDRITVKLITSDTFKDPNYRELLYKDLNNYVAAYHSALCYADLNMVSIESDHDLFNREVIRSLLAELRTDCEIGEIENQVARLDELFLQMRKHADESRSNKSQVPASAMCTPVIDRSESHYICGKSREMRQV